MTESGAQRTVTGGCHCGRVRFSVRLSRDQTALECNCSICTKKGFLHLIVAAEQFELRSGQDVMSTYTFNTGIAEHTFCRLCGIHAFYRPRSHPDGFDVNMRCLDTWPEWVTITPFDGRHWEDRVAEIRGAGPRPPPEQPDLL